MSIQSDAVEPWNGGEAIELTDSTKLDPDEGDKWLSFTPGESGDYRFFSEGEDVDPAATLYGMDEEGDYQEFASGDDENESNFSFKNHLEADAKYYLLVHFHSGASITTINVEKAAEVTGIAASVRDGMSFTRGDGRLGAWTTESDEDGNEVRYFDFYNIADYIDVEAAYADGTTGSLRPQDFLLEYSSQNLQVGENPITVRYNDEISCELTINIVESDVSAIEYASASQIVLTQGVDSDYEWDDDDVEYHHYSFDPFREGDILSVQHGDGEYIDYTYSADEDAFVSEEGERIDRDAIKTENGQRETHWSEPGEYAVTFTYMGVSTEIYVKVQANNVSKIKYIPAEPYEFVEGIDGELDSNEAGEEFTCYYVRAHAGDVLEVYTEDADEPVVYTLEDEDWEFRAEDGSIIPESDVRFDVSGRQYEEPWTIDSESYVDVTYRGATCLVPVTIKANTVASISYKQAEAFEVVEGTQDGSGWYDMPRMSAGDVLTVVDANGASEEYTYAYDEEDEWYSFRNADGKILRGEVNFTSDQDDTPWTIDGENVVTVSYMGKECPIYVKVVSNPVKSISYAPAGGAIELVAGLDGYWETSYEDDDEGTDWYCYAVGPSDGDVLTVEYADGRTVDYTYLVKYDVYRSAGDEEDITESVVYDYSGQDASNPWVLGGEYEGIAKYMGRTCTFPVKIVENDVTAIEYEPAQDAVCYEQDESDHSAIWYNEGDKMTVYRGDEAAVYTFDSDDMRFVADDGSFITWSEVRFQLYEDEDLVAGECEYTATYRELNSSPLTLTVLARDVKSLSFTPANPVTCVIGRDGCNALGDNGAYAFDYFQYVPAFHEGDKLTVVAMDGESADYVYREAEKAFVKGEAKISASELEWYDEQSFDPWEKAGVYKTQLLYHGRLSDKIEVTLKEAAADESGTDEPVVKKVQSITASDVEKTFGAKPFSLGATAQTALSYTSSNEKVAKVDAKGTVTIVGAGKATITVTAAETDAYKGATKAVAIAVAKAANPVAKAKAKKKAFTVKAKALKKKAKSFAAKKAYAVPKDTGTLSYKKANKAGGKKIVVNKKTGKITLKKGLKKGTTYKVKVKITAKGTANYKGGSKTVTLKFKVK